MISDSHAVEAFDSRGRHQKLDPYGVSRHNFRSSRICLLNLPDQSVSVVNGQFETPRTGAIDSKSQYEKFR